MLTRDELVQHIAAYQSGQISFADFENWFEDSSCGAYSVQGVADLCAAVDLAISQYYFEHVGEDALKLELAAAIASFAHGPPHSQDRL